MYSFGTLHLDTVQQTNNYIMLQWSLSIKDLQIETSPNQDTAVLRNAKKLPMLEQYLFDMVARDIFNRNLPLLYVPIHLNFPQ